MHDRHPYRPFRTTSPFLWIGGLCAAIELTLWGLELLPGWFLPRYWMIDQLGFWPGRLGNWQSWIDIRPVTMFATYWLIHAGFLHFLGNMAILVWLERQIGPALSDGAIWEIWVASVLGGAVAYSVLMPGFSPMVGASGGVFGLVGAVVVLRHRNAIARGVRFAAMRTGLLCLFLAVLSVADFLLRDAVLAWQAHLGGFVAGGIMTALGRSVPRAR